MTRPVSITNSPAEPIPDSVPLPELPEGFFAGMRPKEKSWGEKQRGLQGMLWYDSIIDDLLANPGAKLVETAKRLNKSPNTLYLICGSDLFKARYAQRRARHENDLHERITGKITKLAELTLDATIKAVEAKQESMPIQHLKEIGKDALDRLGYAPSSGPSAPAVVIQNNVAAQAAVPSSVTPEALAEARAAMRKLQELSPPSEGPVVEGKVEGGD